jgi:hypothetical protein
MRKSGAGLSECDECMDELRYYCKSEMIHKYVFTLKSGSCVTPGHSSSVGVFSTRKILQERYGYFLRKIKLL